MVHETDDDELMDAMFFELHVDVGVGKAAGTPSLISRCCAPLPARARRHGPRGALGPAGETAAIIKSLMQEVVSRKAS
jgi:hypothetical protein